MFLGAENGIATAAYGTEFTEAGNNGPCRHQEQTPQRRLGRQLPRKIPDGSTTYGAIALPFPPWQQRELHAERESASTCDRGHGRIEHRERTNSVLLKDRLDWPGVQQVCQLRRTTTRGGRTTTDVQYAIANVDLARAAAAGLLSWWRGHWGIENKVHWVRDETFGEDRCRVRTKSAPQVLSSVRNLAMNWFRSQKIGTIAQALRQSAWNPQPLLTKLGRYDF